MQIYEQPRIYRLRKVFKNFFKARFALLLQINENLWINWRRLGISRKIRISIFAQLKYIYVFIIKSIDYKLEKEIYNNGCMHHVCVRSYLHLKLKIRRGKTSSHSSVYI